MGLLLPNSIACAFPDTRLLVSREAGAGQGPWASMLAISAGVRRGSLLEDSPAALHQGKNAVQIAVPAANILSVCRAIGKLGFMSFTAEVE